MNGLLVPLYFGLASYTTRSPLRHSLSTNGPDETEVAGSELYSPPLDSRAFFCIPWLKIIMDGRNGAGCCVSICRVCGSIALTPSASNGCLPATTSSQFLMMPLKNQVKSQACLGSAP